MSTATLAPPVEALSRDPDWLVPLRASALERYRRRGLPTLRDEDWRFTNVSALADLALAPPRDRPPVPEGVLDRSLLHGLDLLRLVFIDGIFVPELSDRPEGMTVRSLDACLEEPPAILRRSLGEEDAETVFADLNAAWFAGGVLLEIERRSVCPRPVHAIFVSSGSRPGLTAAPRNLVCAGEGSSAILVEEYLGEGSEPGLTSALTGFEVGRSARIEHIKIQNESAAWYHMGLIRARLDRDCSFRSHSFALGARLSRNDIRVRLEGEGLECVLNGLYLTRGRQLADHHMVVDHAAPRCRSHEYFNGILEDESRGVFHGRILVRSGAQKTDAKQTNRNLILSDNARANTKPQLEIHADDVRCTHGATIGQLDEEAVFYLMARGIPRPGARAMLQLAFAEEIVDRIGEDAVRERLHQVIRNRLR